MQTDEVIEQFAFQGEQGKDYEWRIGDPISDVEEIVKETDDPDGSGGGSGSGGCPGPQAQSYKNLMDNSPTNDCQQIWAQQAVWHAYKCNCDNGLATTAAANQMVATLNSIRVNIENLYKSGGSGPYTKCGTIPATVTKCNVK